MPNFAFMMKQELISLLPAGYPDNARVWIYQSNRAFIEKEELEINEQLHHFYAQWKSHGAPAKGWAKLLFKQFVVVIADESEVQLGGCSIDDAMRQIKSFERQYDVNFFNRLLITFLIKSKAEMLPLNQVQYAIDNGYINKDTLMFNNVIANKKELLEKWLVPLNESWLWGRVQIPA